MGFCGKCGSKVSEEFSFCSVCGAPLKEQNKQGRYQSQNTQGGFTDNIGAGAEKAFNNAKDFVNNTKDTTYQYHPEDIKTGKVMSALAYIWILFFLPLAVCPESKFGRFHANQGLILLIFGAILGMISGILSGILSLAFRSVGYYDFYYYTNPLGIAIISIVCSITGIIYLVFVIIGILNAVNGKAKELPIIGKFRLIK